MIYDLHVHTKYSICSNLKLPIVLKIAKKKKLDGLAITDHNTIKGALKVASLNKNKDFEVIIGAEIKTNKGDVLAYYLNEEIKERDLFEVIDKVKEQGGVVIIAHPFRIFPWSRFKLDIKEVANKIDGIEGFNSRNILLGNIQAIKVAKSVELAITAGSDAHFSFEIGQAVTKFEGSLIKAIKQRKTYVQGKTTLALVGGTLSLFLKLRALI